MTNGALYVTNQNGVIATIDPIEGKELLDLVKDWIQSHGSYVFDSHEESREVYFIQYGHLQYILEDDEGSLFFYRKNCGAHGMGFVEDEVQFKFTNYPWRKSDQIVLDD